MTTFIPGTELSRRFYDEAVRPLLRSHFPHLVYAAAHLGPGSDVLGFDTEMSTDHDWGPRFFLFLREEDMHLQSRIDALLREQLPTVFYGYPVSISQTADAQQSERGVLDHRVNITTLRSMLLDHLDYDLDQPLMPADWLSISSQQLREWTTGAVHHDGIGTLTNLRSHLHWYPTDVWLYLLAAGWHRLAQEEHLMPRAGFVGDELGSALIGSRLVRDVMSLCFLYEKHYAPYPKWFGTAFRQLTCAADITPFLWRATQAATWQAREEALCDAYIFLASIHNAAGITEPLETATRSFFGRPFTVIMADRFADALRAAIGAPDVQRIAAQSLLGSIDQFSDSTDLRSHAHWRKFLLRLYQAEAE
jgi:hypothetical protein